MKFFNRWYIQKPVTKVSSTEAMEILEAADPNFPTVPKTKALREKALKDAGEIHMHNLKFPVANIRKLWGLSSNDVLDVQSYAAAVAGETIPSFNPDDFVTTYETDEEFIDAFEVVTIATAKYTFQGKEFMAQAESSVSYTEAVEQAKEILLSLLEAAADKQSGYSKQFSKTAYDEILSNFLDYETDKIAKVGQYLKGENVELAGLDRKLQPMPQGGLREGIILQDNIFLKSHYIFTGKIYIAPGPTDSSLVCIQVLVIIPENEVDGTPTAESGITPLSLNEIRLLSCKPTKPKKRKQKSDDPNVRNDAEKGYRTKDQRRRRQLSPKQKEDLAERVRSRVLNVADSSFLRALANADKIKTTKDAFDFVLNVIPLNQMIAIALQCANKYISAPPEDKVCETIMNLLQGEDVEKIMRYVNVNVDGDAIAQSFKTYIIDEFNELNGVVFEDDPSGLYKTFIDYLNYQFQNNITNRQIICGIIYASIPAAITLLALLIEEDIPSLEEDGSCADPLSPLSQKTKSLLQNPVKDGLAYIYKSLLNHPIVGLAKNFVDTSMNQVIMFVDEVIIQSTSILLQELAYLCEDSDKSDLANALASGDAFNNNIEDILTSRDAFDAAADFIDDAVASSEENFDDCEELLSSNVLIQDFFDDIARTLSVSELCVLFNGDISSINYNAIFDKLYFGLLRLPKYECLKRVLDTRGKFQILIDIFADFIDEVACQERIEEHTKSKKIISDLCESSDAALIDDLTAKASDDLVGRIIDQEESLLNDLLKSIKTLTDPPQPEMFCGPEAEKSGKTPLVPTFQEESQLYLSKKFLTSIFTASEKLFESEIDNFKIILTNPVNFNAPGGLDLSKYFTAASQVAVTMSKIYDVQLKGADGMPLNAPTQEMVKKYLQDITANGKLVAPQLRSNLVGTESNLNVVFLDENAFMISTGEFSWGTLQYVVNYSDNEILLGGSAAALIGNPDYKDFDIDLLSVPPGTSKLIFTRISSSDTIQTTAATYQTNLGDNFPTMPSSIFSSYSNSVNNDDNSEYLSIIKNNVYTKQFYTSVLEQIIREHAEFVSASDLFQKKVLDGLQLSKDNFCDTSLLKYDDILEKMENRIKKVECYTGMGKIPTPSEKVQMASVYEAMIRVVVAQEMTKSFFVFASFGFDALLPTINDDGGNDTLNSFYFDYLIEQVAAKIDEFIPSDKVELLETAVEETTAADNNLNKPSVDFSVIQKDLIQNTIRSLQSQVADKLTKAGIKTKLSSGAPGTEGSLFNEASILSNIDPNDTPSNITKAKAFLNNVRPTTEPYDKQPLPPPTIKAMTAAAGSAVIETAFEIEPLYSTIPELINGGIFIERGIEIFHNRPASGNKSAAKSSGNALSATEIDLLIDALPLDLTLGEEYEIMVQEAPIVEYAIPFIAEFAGVERKYLKYIQLWEPTPSDDINYQMFLQSTNTFKLWRNNAGASFLPDVYDKWAQFNGAPNYFELWMKATYGPDVQIQGPYIDLGLWNVAHPHWLKLLTPAEVASQYSFDVSGYNKGTGKPLGLNKKNILNILGRTNFSTTEGVILQPGAKLELDNKQKNLFGGQAIQSDGAISSTIFKEDFPYGFEPGQPNQINFFKRQGRIPIIQENVTMISDILKDMNEFATKLKQGISDKGVESTEDSPNNPQEILNNLYGAVAGPEFAHQLEYLKKRMNTIDTYFYKLGTYETVNLLIRLDQADVVGDDDLQQIIQQLHNISISTETEQSGYNLSSFSNAVLERKFIIKDNGIFYFKLPIGYSYKPFDNAFTPDVTFILEQPFDDKFNPMLDILSSLQYENILSFVSIFVTNGLTYSYPQLNSLFNKTLLTLQAALLNQMAIADRVEDQSYYANNFNQPQLIQFQESEANILALFFEGILKAVANTTDPFWRTPWFAPGPLTPFGILAKLISGEDDVDEPLEAANRNQVPSKEVYDCPDEQ